MKGHKVFPNQDQGFFPNFFPDTFTDAFSDVNRGEDERDVAAVAS